MIDGTVNILGDLSVDGNLKVLGSLDSKEINTEKLNIATPTPDPTTGKSKASVGTGTIGAGQTEILIETTAVTADSRIFVTATTKTGKVLSVTEKTAGDKFKVEIPDPDSLDIEFSWFIIN